MDKAELSVVLSGGMALGAYQAGVYEGLQAAHRVGWIAASSVGAVNGALVVGVPAEQRKEALAAYWLYGSPWQADPWVRTGSVRHVFNWLSVAQGRLLGSPRHVRAGGLQSLYDLQPTVDYLRRAIDFGRLNGGEIRFTVATVDIETGDPVYFDAGKGQRIEMDHIVASCGFLPEFAPVELGGRLLGDGGLGVNAPIEPVLDEQRVGTALVVDLFARDGERPGGLEAALQRKNGLLFGNQTYARLDIYRKHWEKTGHDAPSVFTSAIGQRGKKPDRKHPSISRAFPRRTAGEKENWTHSKRWSSWRARFNQDRLPRSVEPLRLCSRSAGR
jgi:NTE family protein